MTNSNTKAKDRITGRPEWENPLPVKSMKKHFLYYGRGMRENCDKFQVAYLSYVSHTFGTNVATSIEKNTLVMEVDEPADVGTAEDFKKLSHLKQRQWEAQFNEHREEAKLVGRDLGKCYGTLIKLCHVTMMNKLKADPDYQKLINPDPDDDEEKPLNKCGELFCIIKSICSGGGATHNAFKTFFKSMFNLLLS